MSSPSPRPVFVIGSFVMACCWFTPRLPGRGEHVHADRFLMEPGGKGLNVAVALQRLGATVHLLLGHGDDPASHALTDLLKQEALPLGHVHRLAGASGHGVGVIDEQGEHFVAIHPGANHRLNEAHARAATADIAASALVYGQFEAPDAVITTVFDIARQAGTLTVLNPSPWRPIADALLATVDTLLLNEHEASSLFASPTDARAPAAAWLASAHAWRLAHPGIELVVTLGEAGCLWWPAHAATPSHHAARRVQAVDTTGCGDAFAAAWCDGQARGLPAAEALSWAQAAGAWVATQQGVLDALPSRERLQAWLAGES